MISSNTEQSEIKTSTNNTNINTPLSTFATSRRVFSTRPEPKLASVTNNLLGASRFRSAYTRTPRRMARTELLAPQESLRSRHRSTSQSRTLQLPKRFSTICRTCGYDSKTSSRSNSQDSIVRSAGLKRSNSRKEHIEKRFGNEVDYQSLYQQAKFEKEQIQAELKCFEHKLADCLRLNSNPPMKKSQLETTNLIERAEMIEKLLVDNRAQLENFEAENTRLERSASRTVDK